MALGVTEGARYATLKRPLCTGDLLILFTDGLYEVENHSAETYGRSRLPHDLRKRIKMTPPRLLDDLIEHILNSSSNRKFEDDVCVVAMEVCGQCGFRKSA